MRNEGKEPLYVAFTRSGIPANLEERARAAAVAAGEGQLIRQNLVGAYMYLRSLIGPVELLYAVHDQPALSAHFSPDGKWLAYTAPDKNQMTRIYLYNAESGAITPATSR